MLRPTQDTQLYFGELPEYPVGSRFATRIDLMEAGVHRQKRSGIAGNQREGATSVVLNGSYEDDADQGDTVLYVGRGGRDPRSGKQVADQQLAASNLALARSCERGLPLRLIRGAGGHPDHAPAEGYRYDGLYRITEYGPAVGASGYRVWLFRLERCY